MGIEEFLLYLAIVFIGVPAAWLVGGLLARLTGVRWLANALPLAALLLGLGVVPATLHTMSVPTTATVVERREQVRLTSNGESRHDFFLVVSYAPSEQGAAGAGIEPAAQDGRRRHVTAQLVATAPVYDGAPVGSTVAVRYLPQRPSVATLEAVSYLDMLSEAVNQPGNRLAVLMLSLFGIAFALVAWTPRSETSRGLRRAWLSACGVGLLAVIVWERVSPLFEPTAEPEFTGYADASVLRVSQFTERRADDEIYELAHPFEVVQVEFTPAELGLPVRATDAIDVGSVPGLTEGASVRIRYAPDAHRTIRIEGATREFVRANAWHEGLEWLAIAALCAAALLFGLWTIRRKRRRELARAPLPVTG